MVRPPASTKSRPSYSPGDAARALVGGAHILEASVCALMSAQRIATRSALWHHSRGRAESTLDRDGTIQHRARLSYRLSPFADFGRRLAIAFVVNSAHPDRLFG